MIDNTQLVLDAMSWAREAGAVHLRYFRGQNLDIHNKLNDSDIVTAADKAAEKVILDNIHASYPDHAVLSEESGQEEHPSDYRWVIDPLDGTTNFSNGLPIFSVSIALEYKGEAIVGVVFAPYLNELFHAVKGEGAYLNGEPIHVSAKTELSQSVVCTGFPVDKENPDNNVDNVARVMPLVRGMRRLGSAAMDMCYVAASFLDGYWEMNIHHWDVAAGQLIVSEAGGVYTHYREDRNVSIVAGPKNLHDQLLKLIK